MLLGKRMEVFLAAAEAGSFSRAGRHLSISQSVVSFHVHALVTREGELLYEEGRRLAQAARRLEDRFSEQSSEIAQRISLAGDAPTWAFTLPWTLARFRDAHPGVLYSYQHLDEDVLLDRVAGGEIDVALVGHPVKHRRLATQTCFEDEIILVGSEDASARRITLAALRELPLLWATNDRGLELLLNKGLAEAGLPVKDLNLFMEVENLAILKTFVRAGVGVAFLPRLTVADELHFALLMEIGVEGLDLKRTNYLVHRKETQPREIVQRFLDFVQTSDWQDLAERQFGRKRPDPPD